MRVFSRRNEKSDRDEPHERYDNYEERYRCAEGIAKQKFIPTKAADN